MPIYEYRCTQCGHEFDTLQKVSDAPLTVCPKCNESALVKKISAAGFRLKGGGWYETDFKSGKKRNVAGESSGDAGKSSGEGAGKSSGEGAGSSGASAGKSSDSSASPSASGSKGSSSASSDGG